METVKSDILTVTEDLEVEHLEHRLIDFTRNLTRTERKRAFHTTMGIKHKNLMKMATKL